MCSYFHPNRCASFQHYPVNHTAFTRPSGQRWNGSHPVQREQIAHLVRDEGVAGSNPATPTSFLTAWIAHGEQYGERNPDRALFQCVHGPDKQAGLDRRQLCCGWGLAPPTNWQEALLSKDRLLLRQIGGFLPRRGMAGTSARDLRVSERTIRRWVAGTEEIPRGVWRDLSAHLEIYDRTTRLSRRPGKGRCWPDAGASSGYRQSS